MGRLNVMGTSKGVPVIMQTGSCFSSLQLRRCALGLLRDPPVKGPNVILEVAAAGVGNGRGQPERPFPLCSNLPERAFKKDGGSSIT